MNLLENAIKHYDQSFALCWKKIIKEYKTTNENKVWLAGPSSYIFSIDGLKFAVDLQIRRDIDFKAVEKELVDDLKDLSFVLITHEHGDHMCVPLIKALKDTDIKWYLPENTRADYIEKSEIRPENIVWTKPSDVFEFYGVKISAFFTPHAKGDQPFLQCGYHIATKHGNILIPGDIRDYDYSGYPDFGSVDLCISHLWAGKDSSNSDSYLPMLEKFVNTCSAFEAKRYFLCHLYEIGRKIDSMWTYKHAGIAMDMFYQALPQSVIEIPKIGESYNLFDE